MLTFKEFKEECQKDMPDEAVANKGKAIDFKTDKEFYLVGYKWQYYMDFLNNLDIIWSHEIRNVKDYPEHRKIAACVRIYIKCEDGETFFDGYGVAEYQLHEINNQFILNLSLVGKSAIDDALGRACAKFGLGMKAYKGLETRKPKKDDYKKLLEQLQDPKHRLGIKDKKLEEFLEDKNFEGNINWGGMLNEDYKKVYEFVVKQHPTLIGRKLVREFKQRVGEFKIEKGEIKDVKDFKVPPSIYGVFIKLAKQFGTKLFEKEDGKTPVDKIPVSAYSIDGWVRYLTHLCSEKKPLDEDTKGIG